jgi:hypothetical protein
LPSIVRIGTKSDFLFSVLTIASTSTLSELVQRICANLGWSDPQQMERISATIREIAERVNYGAKLTVPDVSEQPDTPTTVWRWEILDAYLGLLPFELRAVVRVPAASWRAFGLNASCR